MCPSATRCRPFAGVIELCRGRIIKRFSFALIISALISILYYSCDYSDTDEVETADSGAETENQAAVSHIERGDGNELILSGTDSFDTAVFDFADELGADFAGNGFSVVFGDAVLYFGKPISGEGGAAARKLDSIEAYGRRSSSECHFSATTRLISGISTAGFW